MGFILVLYIYDSKIRIIPTTSRIPCIFGQADGLIEESVLKAEKAARGLPRDGMNSRIQES